MKLVNTKTASHRGYKADPTRWHVPMKMPVWVWSYQKQSVQVVAKALMTQTSLSDYVSQMPEKPHASAWLFKRSRSLRSFAITTSELRLLNLLAGAGGRSYVWFGLSLTILHPPGLRLWPKSGAQCVVFPKVHKAKG